MSFTYTTTVVNWLAFEAMAMDHQTSIDETIGTRSHRECRVYCHEEFIKHEEPISTKSPIRNRIHCHKHSVELIAGGMTVTLVAAKSSTPVLMCMGGDSNVSATYGLLRSGVEIKLLHHTA